MSTSLSSSSEKNKRLSDCELNNYADEQLDIGSIRDTVANELIKAYNREENILLESLPASGKTYGTFKATNETGEQILYLTSLNRLKEDAIEYCEDNDFNLSYAVIPSPFDYCDSFEKQRVRDLYSSGISGKELHSPRSDISIPCDEKEHCEYIHKLNELQDRLSEIDVLIGNPKQAYETDYMQDRTVVKDEFSAGEFETRFSNPKELIRRFANTVKSDKLPFDSFEDILKIRDTHTEQNLQWYHEYGAYRDVKNANRPEDYHVNAPFLAYFLLYAEELNEKWEYLKLADVEVEHPFNDSAICVRNREVNRIHLLNPPEFEQANGFVGLDGTPVPEMWDLSVGMDLEHRQVIPEEMKQDYISNILNLEIIETNDSLKPYHNSEYVTVPKDEKIAYGIWQEEGEKPTLISTKRAKDKYEQENSEIFDYIDEYENYANVLSVNDFEKKDIGFVNGFSHYGDTYIQKWASYQGKELQTNGKRGTERKYWYDENKDDWFNPFPYYQYQLLQAVFRFGRETDGQTTVYANSCGLPDWVPTQQKDVIEVDRTGREVLEYLKDSGEVISSDLAEEFDFTKRTGQMKLKQLAEAGLIGKQESSGAFSPDKYEWCAN